MPKCYYCDRDTPTTKMILVREYEESHGQFYYFCSWFHLIAWLDEKYMKPKKNNTSLKLTKR